MQKDKMNKLKNKRNGFTLVETLFGISIFILICLVLTLLARNIWKYNSFISLGLTNSDNIRPVLKTMTAEIRTASSANTGAYTISEANSTSFIFYSDIDDNELKERVRYFLNGNLLQRGITVPTGSPLIYNLATEKINTLLTDVTSSLIFDYYNSSYDGTTAPLPSPIDIAAIRLIKITVVVDKDLNNPPAAVTFSTQISIRNLKDNL